MNKVIFHI